MCEPLMPIDELKNLRFAVSSLASTHPKGSYEGENARNTAEGIKSRLNWCIRQLEAAGEGKKNCGA